jgi:hypothetical protein
MPVESASHISELIDTNPLATDDVAQGDDQIRLIKTVLLADFANINAAVTADPTDLNRTDVAAVGVAAASEVVTVDGAGNIDFSAVTITGLGEFESGIRMLFQQTAAPTGWTKDQSDTNERALRVVSGNVVNGGDTNFTTVFTATKTTSSEAGHTHTAGTLVTGSPSDLTARASGGINVASQDHAHTISGSTGANSSHTHTSDLAVFYLDVIVAAKD